jgi:excisionase family DNA binding protein
MGFSVRVDSKSVPTRPAADPQLIPRLVAAQRLSCSDQYIDKCIRLGRLPAYKLGRKVLVKWSDCLRLLEEIR